MSNKQQKSLRYYHENISQMISWGHWFTLFNILICLPIASFYLLNTDWPHTLLGRIYAFLSLIGHFSFLPFIIYLLILFPLTFLIRSQKLMRLVSAIIATIGLTLLLIDTVIFDQFRLHLNHFVWLLVIASPGDETIGQWYPFFVIIPIIFLIELLFGSWSWKKLRSLTKRRYLAKPFVALFITAFTATHILHSWADANFYRPITMQRANYPLYYPLTARKFLEKYGLLDRQNYEHKLQEEGQLGSIALEYPLDKLRFANDTEHYNLLMITIDAIHYPTFKQTMPLLAKFAEKNSEFTQHISTGNEKITGLMGLFYGISPTYLESIISWHKPSALMNSFNQQNYQLNLLASDGFDNALYRQALFGDYTLPAAVTLTNQQITQQWQQWFDLQRNSNKWFSYINYSTEPNSDVNHNKQLGVSLYQSTLKEIDQQIEGIIHHLAANNLLSSTVIVITANYGIDIDNHQNANAVQDFRRTHLHVPLIIHWPNRPAETINKLTSHEDIMATLMQDLLHVATNPVAYTQGENLFIPKRKFNWVTSGNDKSLVITTSKQTIILKHNGSYAIYDKNYHQLKHEKLNIPLLLQVLTENKRFVAD